MRTAPLTFRGSSTITNGGRIPGRKPFAANIVEKLVGIQALRQLYARAVLRSDRSFFESVLAELQVTINVSRADLARIPSAGPAIVCANHPFGILDGTVLGATLMRVRTDVRILTNLLLKDIPELEPYCFWIDPFAAGDASDSNCAAIRKAVRWLNNGGMLATFPAGEVSHWSFRNRTVADPQWSDTAIRLARMGSGALLPVYFNGQNSLVFQGLGCLHSRLRTLRLPSELLNKVGAEVTLRIGSPIASEKLRNIESDTGATSHLRARCEVLSIPESRSKSRSSSKMPVLPISEAIPVERVATEMESLIASHRLTENAEFVVVAACASEIPHTLHELGRQREIAFRAAGEGSGQALDLDEFDQYYTHLLLWNKDNQELAGAYRIGATKRILPRYGAAGLYTSTLFDYDERFFYSMGPGLELGRSFISPKYQKQFAPVLLLWKAIAQYAVQNPDSPVLFGAVSISADYSRVSRELIAEYFDQFKPVELSGLIKPRCPVRYTALDEQTSKVLTSFLGDTAALARLIGDIEPDNKSIPVLLSHYLKLNGRVLAFNLDRKFSDVVDGLIYVDLRQTDDRALGRFMSREGLRHFRRYHARLAPDFEPEAAHLSMV
jgi:putative hemolysin